MSPAHDEVMETRDLAWFVALAESSHVTQTAEDLHIAQPTLSRAVLRLEKDFGAPLFDRVGNRLRLSRQGEVLQAHALRLLSELDSASRRIDSMIDPYKGVVSLAYVTSFGSWLVPRLLTEYQVRAPASRFLLEGGPADGVLDMVRNGTADAAIVSPRPQDEALTWHMVAAEPLLLTVPAGHELASRSSVVPADLPGYDIVALRPQFGLRQITDQLFARAGVEPSIVMETTEIQTLWGLVAAGIGAAVLPEATTQAHAADTRQIPIDDEHALREVGLVTIAGKRHSAPVEAFVGFVLGHDHMFP
jgi:LysR family transcriptional activator of glutamate synthase operon